jgi:quinol monooxygenase YgiN
MGRGIITERLRQQTAESMVLPLTPLVGSSSTNERFIGSKAARDLDPKEEEAGLYGIIDTFADEVGRDAHLNGELAKALFGKADELFSEAPKVHRLHVIAQK